MIANHLSWAATEKIPTRSYKDSSIPSSLLCSKSVFL